jgi:5-methyltetrahydrofolate--homocysteine methyltransferase
MESFLNRVKQGRIFVADGAMGTMLFQRGLKPGDCPEALNLSSPEILRDIASLYLEAGAEIIQTNSFGGSPLKLAAYNLAEKAEEINRMAVEIVKNAINDKALIYGSCGPCGRILKPYGDTEPDEIHDSFKIQAKALIEAGVDMICVETMTDLSEAQLAIRAVRDISPDLPIMATMTFDPTPGGFYTIMGIDIKQAAMGLEEAGANIIGSNCGNGIENMIKIAREFKAASSLPIIIQSNAGLPKMEGTTVVYDETPEFMAEKAKELIALGVSVIGGCCGTTPEHIRAIKQMIISMEGSRG